MIADKMIAVFYNLMNSFIQILPDVGNAPSWVSSWGQYFGMADYFVPAHEIMNFLPIMGTVFLALYAWRAVRLITPGG